MLSDCEYVLADLQAHPNGRDAMQIINASLRDREVGLTVHSRVADLRRDGYKITCQIEGKTRKGRERYVYRLQENVPAPGAVNPSALSGSDSGVVPGDNPDQVRAREAAGPVEPPAVGHVALGAEIPAPVPDVIPGQLEMAL